MMKTKLSTNPDDSAHLGEAFVWLHAYALGRNPEWSHELGRTEGRQGDLLRLFHWEAAETQEDLAAFCPGPGLSEEVKYKRVAHSREDHDLMFKQAQELQQTLRWLAADLVKIASELPGKGGDLAKLAILGWMFGVGCASRHNRFWKPYITIGRKSFEGAQAGGRMGGKIPSAARVERNEGIRGNLQMVHLRKPHYTFNKATDVVGERFSLSGKQVRRICEKLRWEKRV